MTGNRARGTWVWVAVAAITLASLARAQSGIENARAYATPLIAFFSDGHMAESGTLSSAQRQTSASHDDPFGTALNLLPVFFIGLISFTIQSSSLACICIGRVLASATGPASFQRPPPICLA